MPTHPDIDAVLRSWPYRPGTISARKIRARNGRRELLQMRIEMGVLQMETSGRPDGARPEGFATYLDLLQSRAEDAGGGALSDDDCVEMDREFLQYYHRRICWLALREFPRAVEDADHTLALMDYARGHSPGNQWTESHEQYRGFVLFHRTQAATLAALEIQGAAAAIKELQGGLARLRSLHAARGRAEPFEEDQQVAQLLELADWLRRQHDHPATLEEQLAEAVAAEQYELAAKLRDQIARRS
jgi:hypothetical protein